MVFIPPEFCHDPLTALHEARSGNGVLDADTIESIADAAHSWAGTTLVGDLIEAARCKLVFVDFLGPEMPAAYVPHLREILVRRAKFTQWTRVLMLHELAHALLGCMFSTHTDVWCLTLALSFPRLHRRQRPPPLLADNDCRDVPAWVERERALILAAAVEREAG